MTLSASCILCWWTTRTCTWDSEDQFWLEVDSVAGTSSPCPYVLLNLFRPAEFDASSLSSSASTTHRRDVSTNKSHLLQRNFNFSSLMLNYGNSGNPVCSGWTWFDWNAVQRKKEIVSQTHSRTYIYMQFGVRVSFVDDPIIRISLEWEERRLFLLVRVRFDWSRASRNTWRKHKHAFISRNLSLALFLTNVYGCQIKQP